MGTDQATVATAPHLPGVNGSATRAGEPAAAPDAAPGPVEPAGDRPGTRPAAGYPRAGTRRWTWVQTALVLLVPMLGLICFRFVDVITDPDYFWHLRTGQYIVETGTLPRTDVFSFSVPDRPWVPHEWLTEVLFFLVQSQFGYVANAVIYGLLGAATAATVYATCRAWGVGELGSTVFMLWAFAIQSASMNVRPQIWTMLFLAVTVLLITRYKQGHRHGLWLMPPLMVLWVNLHGGYVIGLAVLGLAIVGETLSWLWRRPHAPLRPLVIVTTLTALATLVSPNGLDGLLYPFSYAGTANASMRYITEWQSPNFHQPMFYGLALSLLLALLVGVGRAPLGPTEALWTMMLAAMALQSSRHMPLYAIVVMPLIAARLAHDLPGFRASIARWRRPGLLAVAWLLLIAFVVMRAGDASRAEIPLQLGREPISAGYPEGGIRYMREHGITGNLFNEYGWGGYVVDQFYPERRVFIDGRADVYGDEFVEKYMATYYLKEGWRAYLDKYDIRVVLVMKDEALGVVLADDPAWTQVYLGKVERLLVRNP